MAFWPLTNSDFQTDQTFHQFHDLDTELDLNRIMGASMEHLQRVLLASREHLPFRTPGSVGLACAPIVEIRLLELVMSLLDFSPWITLGTFSILLLQIPHYLWINAAWSFYFVSVIIVKLSENQSMNYRYVMCNIVFTNGMCHSNKKEVPRDIRNPKSGTATRSEILVAALEHT